MSTASCCPLMSPMSPHVLWCCLAFPVSAGVVHLPVDQGVLMFSDIPWCPLMSPLTHCVPQWPEVPWSLSPHYPLPPPRSPKRSFPPPCHPLRVPWRPLTCSLGPGAGAVLRGAGGGHLRGHDGAAGLAGGVAGDIGDLDAGAWGDVPWHDAAALGGRPGLRQPGGGSSALAVSGDTWGTPGGGLGTWAGGRWG